MRTYIKKKAGPKKGPKYRTPDHFSPRNRFGEAGSPRFIRGETGKGSKFGGKGQAPTGKFNPGQFKVQHKG